MVFPICFIILFVLFLIEIIMIPKVEGKINILKAMIMGVMAIFCYLSLGAGIAQIFGIPINIVTNAAILMIGFLGALAYLIKERRIQRYFVEWWDVLVVVVLTGIVLGVAFHMYSTDLQLRFANNDAAIHFGAAMDVLENEHVSGLYFSQYINSIFIELLAPILGATRYYKAFIAANIFMHIWECLMFYTLVRTISYKKAVKYLAPLITLMYFWGYPAYNFLEGGFIYWSMGIMIFIFIIYAMVIFYRYERIRKETAVLIFLGMFANTICHKLFAVLNTVGILVATLVYLRKKGKYKLLVKPVIVVTGIIVAILGMLGYYFSIQWGGSIYKIAEYIKEYGGIYRCLYGDIIYFLPVVVALCYFAIKKKKDPGGICILTLVNLLIAIIMFLVYYNGLMTTYFYYKIYYNLWLLGFCSVVVVIDAALEQKQVWSVASYMTLVITLSIVSICNVDKKMWERDPNYSGSYAWNQFMPLYNYNMGYMSESYDAYAITPKVMDVYNYAIENYYLQYVPIVTNDSQCGYWYDAMMAQKTFDKYSMELPAVVKMLDSEGVQIIVVIKTDDYYKKYQNYFEKCTEIYGNEEAAVITFLAGSWENILGMTDYSQEKLELFQYVAENYSDMEVPLLAGEDAYLDFIQYQNSTGQDSSEYYTWKYQPKDGILNLNKNNVDYIVLLKDDSYYLGAESFFSSQDIVYENEAGMLVKHVGEKWSTVYQ